MERDLDFVKISDSDSDQVRVCEVESVIVLVLESVPDACAEIESDLVTESDKYKVGLPEDDFEGLSLHVCESLIVVDGVGFRVSEPLFELVADMVLGVEIESERVGCEEALRVRV